MSINCARCGRPAPIDLEDLKGGGGGDPSLLPVIVPPDGWIGDPNDPNGGVVCGKCATTSEITRWMTGAALVEESLFGNDE